jgi:outer membrane immunogenic protein
MPTVTTRVGHVWYNALVYLKGELALVGEEHYATFINSIDTGKTRRLRAGWTVGSGVEYPFALNWTWKIEYDYLHFGTRSIALNCLSGGYSPGLSERWDVPQRVHAVKLGINYRFAPIR